MDGWETKAPLTGEFDLTGPAATSWDSYKAVVSEEWNRLLRRDDVDESAMHRFLEQHPCLIPFSYQRGLDDVIHGHHGSINDAVYSKPRLPGDHWFVPDFMRITWDSSWNHIFLIEIEDPRKPLFTKEGNLSAKYVGARGQLTDWRNWFSDARNLTKFRQSFGLDTHRYADRDLRPHRILVYGRRLEVESNERGRQARRDDEAVESLTYDRLAPAEAARQDVSVRAADGRRTVLYVPPTFRLGPVMMEVLDHFDGWDAAIRRSDEIDEDRKEFLIRRIPYWLELAKTHDGPIVHNPRSWE